MHLNFHTVDFLVSTDTNGCWKLIVRSEVLEKYPGLHNFYLLGRQCVWKYARSWHLCLCKIILESIRRHHLPQCRQVLNTYNPNLPIINQLKPHPSPHPPGTVRMQLESSGMCWGGWVSLTFATCFFLLLVVFLAVMLFFLLNLPMMTKGVVATRQWDFCIF